MIQSSSSSVASRLVVRSGTAMFTIVVSTRIMKNARHSVNRTSHGLRTAVPGVFIGAGYRPGVIREMPAFCASGRYLAGVALPGTDNAVDIYTDGACSGNPGPGGWGAVLRYGTRVKELCGGEAGRTTNNRMELMATIRALEELTRPVGVRLHTDSTYVRDGITKWLRGWRQNGWQTAERKPVKNVDLWQRLDVAVQRHRVEWIWVKGHAGDLGNERADAL